MGGACETHQLYKMQLMGSPPLHPSYALEPATSGVTGRKILIRISGT